MAFNHYAKLQRIVVELAPGWYIRRIDQPTRAMNFRGETIEYEHYYRLYTVDHEVVKYGKFQKIDSFAQTLGVAVEELPIVEGM